MTRQGMTLVKEELGFGLEDIEFEYDYRDWESNRMYPLPANENSPVTMQGTRKESKMVKLTAEHALAIERSRAYLAKAIKEQAEPRFKSLIRDDINRLRDVQMSVVHLLHHPELLLTEDRT